MVKNVLKFAVGALAIAALGLGVLFLTRYIRCKQDPTCQAEKYFDDLQKRYKEDTYGGSTPEETLQLFTDALKKGDIELASKYFVVEKQKKELQNLQRVRQQGKLEVMIADVRNLKAENSTTDKAFFILADGENVVTLQVVIIKNNLDKWKISEL